MVADVGRPRGLRSTTRAGVVGLTSLVALLASTVPANVRAAGAPRAMTLARVSLTLSSTSDWTRVTLPGRLAAPRVTRRSGGATQVLSNGILLKSIPAGGATVVLDTVYEEAGGLDPITVTIEKGYRGKASVTIRSADTAAPHTVGPLTNTLRSRTRDVVTRTVPRARLFGAPGPSLPSADPRRLVVAAYYPWFRPSKFASGTTAGHPVHPDTGDALQAVTGQVALARSAGIDVLAQSWTGAARDGSTFDLLTRAARAEREMVTVLLEAGEANMLADPLLGSDPAILEQWLDEALRQAGSNPAFLRAGGVPVVFVFDMAAIPAPSWQAILDHEQARGRPVRLVADSNAPAYAAITWGYYRYGVNFASSGAALPIGSLATTEHAESLDTHARNATYPGLSPRLAVATVSPGYDDRRVRGPWRATMPRGGGSRYQGTWDAALGAAPDWVFVSTWNEWYEGTFVEPSVEYGDLAVRQTAANAARFRAH